MTISVTVWGENVHEKSNEIVASIYPDGMHNAIAGALNKIDGIDATTVTLQEPDHGLTEEKLSGTDVLIWWGHAAHGDVEDQVVERVCKAIWSGMGMVFLHSAHLSKPFKRMMGTPCNLTWREAGERERLWVTSRNHPIAEGVDDYFEIEHEEMYGEPFGVPEPLETVFVSWFQGGEVFRSGLTYKRGAGNIFYFRPGHEVYPTYHNETVIKVIGNGVKWAYNPASRWTGMDRVPNVPTSEAPEVLKERGPRMHQDGDEGLK